MASFDCSILAEASTFSGCILSHTVTLSPPRCLPHGDYSKKPEDGAYISGMFVEGARWDYDTMMIAESQPKILFSPAPLMMLMPCEQHNEEHFLHYECPLYRCVE